MAVYHNSIDIEQKLNSKLIAYINTHDSITAEQQEALTNLQLLAVISLLEQKQRTA